MVRTRKPVWSAYEVNIKSTTPPFRRHFDTEPEARDAACEPGWTYGKDNPISIEGREVYAVYKIS